jgi:hypothetical protein
MSVAGAPNCGQIKIQNPEAKQRLPGFPSAEQTQIIFQDF